MATSLRAHLADAAAYLKEAGQPVHAQSVEAVLAPGGWKDLRDTEQRISKPLSVYVNPSVKAALLEASREFGWPLDALVDEAYEKVAAGEWLPPKRPRGEGGSRAVLPVQVDQGLYDQVHARLAEFTQQAGHQVSHAGIVLSYLCDELGVERPGTGNAESLEMRFPTSLVQHWEQAAVGQGQSLQQIVEDAVPGLVDGSWTPERAAYMTVEKRGPRTTAWSESARQRLWLPLPQRLLADLRGKAEELSDEQGYLVHPGAIVRAILTDRLGEPAE